jgi:hypothetical protein
LQKVRLILVGVLLFLPRLLLLLFTLFSAYGLAKLSVIGWTVHPSTPEKVRFCIDTQSM